MDIHFQRACDSDVARRSANFHPSIWRDYFLAYDSDLTKVDTREEELLQLLKGEVKKMLVLAPDGSLQKLNLIDTIQRLGVAYHFEKEIEASLGYAYDTYNEFIKEDGNDDLYGVALRFRLLRQQGYRVSSDVFNRFKDQEGKFNTYLTSRVDGLLGLYEAAHFRVHGEDILEEALTLTTTHLESMLPNLKHSHLAAQVNQALNLPIQKSLARLSAKAYISIHEEDNLHNELLLKFAKLDFNILQKMHQREISDITRWWKGLDVATKLPFARDRIVELYFWILAVYFEPYFSLARRILTKIISMASIMDDIYDAYGTFDELQLLTDAIERWDVTALDQLPSYMQHFYSALLDVYSKAEQELEKQGKSYSIHYAKAEMKKLAKGYFEEARWFHKSYNIPSFDEYMKVALVTSGYMMLSTAAYLGMGEMVTKDAFDWVTSEPLIIKASAVIGRLSDDLVGHEFEQERGHVASAVECFMNQYGVLKQDACFEFHKQVSDAWKDINAECLRPCAVPMPLLMPILNLARVINLLYKDEDGYTHSKGKVKNFIASVLVDPVII